MLVTEVIMSLIMLTIPDHLHLVSSNHSQQVITLANTERQKNSQLLLNGWDRCAD